MNLAALQEKQKKVKKKQCPEGYFCPVGTTDSAANSEESVSIIQNIISSQQTHHQFLCPKGYFCPIASGQDVRNLGDSYKCAAGYFCEAGSKDEFGRKAGESEKKTLCSRLSMWL